MAKRKKIDMDRVREAEARIDTILRAHPELAERTARFLAADPSHATLEGLMSNPTEKLEHPTVIPLPTSILERADALKPLVAQAPEFQMIGRVTRNSVLRLAMLKGLVLLEEEYQGKGKRPSKA